MSWICPQCDSENLNSDSLCTSCNFPIAENGVQQRGEEDFIQSNNDGVVCKVCSFINDGSVTLCSSCGFPCTDDYKTTHEASIVPHPLGRDFIYGATVGNVGVFFRIWVPNASTVILKGSWNWDQEIIMERMESEPDHFSVFVENAKDGDEYGYKFILEHGDPIEWSQDPRAVHLKDKNSVVYDHKKFVWQDEEFTPPPKNQYVLYQLHVGSFGASDSYKNDGTFRSCAEKLDYLKDLGINCIALLPITKDAHDVCWYDSYTFAIHLMLESSRSLRNSSDDSFAANLNFSRFFFSNNRRQTRGKKH